MNSIDSTYVHLALSVDKLVRFIASVVSILSLATMFIALMLEVIVRYFTDQSLGWATESPNILFPWFVMGGAVLAAQHGQHITVKAILGFLSNSTKKVLFVILELIVIGFFGYLAYVGFDVLDVVSSEVYPITKLSAKWAYIALVTGLFGLVITAASNIILIINEPEPTKIREPLGETEI